MGMTQAQFAALGGIGLGAQHRYEAGSAEPGAAYLSRLANAGVDILHLLTGRHGGGALLDEQTSKLIDQLARLDPAMRSAILTIAELAAKVDSPSTFDPAVSTAGFLKGVSENPLTSPAAGSVSIGFAEAGSDTVEAFKPTSARSTTLHDRKSGVRENDE